MAGEPIQDGELTQLLRGVRDSANPQDAEARVIQLAYEEMRRIAGSIADPRGVQTINATALLHEAWLKLNGKLGDVNDRKHFLALATRAMRQVMADAAKSKSRQKRGGDVIMLTLQESDGAQTQEPLDLADLHFAIEGLRRDHPRQAEVFELRAFGSLTFVEVAEIMEISESSARLDWKFARAWMRAQLNEREPSSEIEGKS